MRTFPRVAAGACLIAVLVTAAGCAGVGAAGRGGVGRGTSETEQPVLSQRPANGHGAAAAGLPVTFVRDGGRTEVLLGGKLLTAFCLDDAKKPYLYPVLSASGRHVTRGYPIVAREGEERDHPHHVSLWFAHGDVNGADFWTNAGGARISAKGDVEVDEAAGTIRAAFEWKDQSGVTVCTEERTMRFAGEGATRSIDFDLTLLAADAPVTLGDTKEGTFAIRVCSALTLKGGGGSIVSSTGERDGACWGKRAAWVAYSGAVEGTEVAVAIMDHPENPRHPTWWHARDYGLFAANPFGAHDFEGKPKETGNMTLAPGERLRLRYRVLIREGAMDASTIEDAWKAFADSK